MNITSIVVLVHAWFQNMGFIRTLSARICVSKGEPKTVFWTILVLEESTEVLRGQLYSMKEDNTGDLLTSIQV